MPRLPRMQSARARDAVGGQRSAAEAACAFYMRTGTYAVRACYVLAMYCSVLVLCLPCACSVPAMCSVLALCVSESSTVSRCMSCPSSEEEPLLLRAI